MENGKARILAAFDPCIITSGKVLLNLPDEKGIQLVGAKIQDGQTTQPAIVPIQRISSTAPGQAQYFIDLTEQSTGFRSCEWKSCESRWQCQCITSNESRRRECSTWCR